MKNIQINLITESISPDMKHIKLTEEIASFFLEIILKSDRFISNFSENIKKNLISYTCNINIMITDSEGIKNMNKKYRNLNKSTNVLSFSYITEDQEPLFIDEDSILVGETILNWEEVLKDSGENNEELFDSLVNLLGHSMLHIIGFKHSDRSNSSLMEEEKKFLTKQINKKREYFTEVLNG